jgi:hypothetical protein
MIRKLAVTAFGVAHGLLRDPEPQHDEILVPIALNGEPCLATVITPYNPLRHADTHKVFTHLYGPDGQPITKGVGGFDSHQRGICIGWRKTRVGETALDTWHMKACSQRALPVSVTDMLPGSHTVGVEWCDATGAPFLSEKRHLAVLPDVDGVRWTEVDSTLSCVLEPVKLLGDPHHGGLHIRFANEVCRHPWSTRYVIPRTAHRGHDDSIMGAWWVLSRFVVRSRTHWLVFMTNPSLGDPPVYSARAYGKLGAFMEPTVTPEKPFHIQCRIGLSTRELTGEMCDEFWENAWKRA